MTNSTPSKIAPREETLDFIRLFARTYRPERQNDQQVGLA